MEGVCPSEVQGRLRTTEEKIITIKTLFNPGFLTNDYPRFLLPAMDQN
jgi:hypothetical protein